MRSRPFRGSVFRPRTCRTRRRSRPSCGGRTASCTSPPSAGRRPPLVRATGSTSTSARPSTWCPWPPVITSEIFGPVLVVMPYDTEEEALDIANESIFGLGGYVFSEDRERIRLRPARGAGFLQRREHQLVQPDGWLQAVGNWSVDGRVRAGGVPRGEVDLRLRRGKLRRRQGRLDGRHRAHVLVAATDQARMPSGSIVTSIRAGSIASMRHLSANGVMISVRLMRCGPQSPGWSSEKQSMK